MRSQPKNNAEWLTLACKEGVCRTVVPTIEPPREIQKQSARTPQLIRLGVRQLV